MTHIQPATLRSRVPASEHLIVALDVSTRSDAEALLRRLRPVVGWFKVGSALFTSAGPDAIAMVHAYGGRVFLDLKFHDIPATVAAAIAAGARLGVAMHDVHLAGGEPMLRAAVEANRGAAGGQWAPGWDRPMLIGVTLLTSDPEDATSTDRAVGAARVAEACGLDGVVASAQDARAIRRACGSGFIIVTPGIRRSVLVGDDQQRTATPEIAARAGVDFLVVGRPIALAPDPRAAAEAILRDIDATFRL